MVWPHLWVLGPSTGAPGADRSENWLIFDVAKMSKTGPESVRIGLVVRKNVAFAKTQLKTHKQVGLELLQASPCHTQVLR